MVLTLESNWAEEAPVELFSSWKVSKMAILRSIICIKEVCILAKVV